MGADAGAQAQQVYSGEVRARYESELGFRVSGKLSERLVDVGATVVITAELAGRDFAADKVSEVNADASEDGLAIGVERWIGRDAGSDPKQPRRGSQEGPRATKNLSGCPLP